VIPTREIARAPIPGGSKPLVLSQRGAEFEIRVGTQLLMQSRAHETEAILAERACAHIASRPAPRLLIGGLGMGFTLAAALRALPPEATVEVAELVADLVEWNRGPLAHLAGKPLEDSRVTVQVMDVVDLLRDRRDAYDAILLDVDNGPQGLTRPANDAIYSIGGLTAARAALRAGGILAIWSVAPDPAFARRLGQAGFEVEEETARARRTKGGRHTIWLASQESKRDDSRTQAKR
jgi:spermidine synthase